MSWSNIDILTMKIEYMVHYERAVKGIPSPTLELIPIAMAEHEKKKKEEEEERNMIAIEARVTDTDDGN